MSNSAIAPVSPLTLRQIRNVPTRATEAILRAGDRDTRYLRAGAGPYLLLLGAAWPLDGSAARLLHLLVKHFRVVAPEQRFSVADAGPAEIIGHPGSFHFWLRDVLEGLGLGRPDVLVDARSAPALLRFGRAEPARIGRIVVFGEGAALQALRDRMGGPPVLPLTPVQTLELPAAPDEALPGSVEEVLMEFLGYRGTQPQPRGAGR